MRAWRIVKYGWFTSSPADILRSLDIGVRLVTATATPKLRLTGAVFLLTVATAGACAAGITRISHFDVYQLCWRPNFDRFFFDQKRSINNFLFRGEFIFELGRTVIGEVPQLGHATYVFTRPADIREFVRRYATTIRWGTRS